MATINVDKKDTFEIWRQKTNLLGSFFGDLSLLRTLNKTSLVAAINELKDSIGDNSFILALIGNKDNLTTTIKSNLVAAINEVNAKLGDLSLLLTDDKTSYVRAINEIYTKQGPLTTLTTTVKTSIVGAINELQAGLANAATGIIPINKGGTGAITAPLARTNLGIGSMGVQDSTSVNITGGSIASSTLTGIIHRDRLGGSPLANRVVGIDASNSSLEYKNIIAGNNISVTHASGGITITGLVNPIGAGSVTSTPNTLVQRDGTGQVFASNFISTSDISVKENVKNLDKLKSLNIVRELNPVEFNFINGETTEFGLIAQQVQMVEELLVRVGTDGLKSVAYQNIIPLLINSIKVLDSRIKELESQNQP